MKKATARIAPSLFGWSERDCLTSALNKVASLGFTADQSVVEQVFENYKGWGLARLIEEYQRAKCSFLGYLVVAACLERKEYLTEAHKILSRLENGKRSVTFSARKSLRVELRRELDALRAE